jgi:uncharacterized membrane protein YfcA
VVWRLVPLLAVGAAVAAPAASWLAQHLPREILARGFALFLMANAIVGWIRAGGRKAATQGSGRLVENPPG